MIEDKSGLYEICTHSTQKTDPESNYVSVQVCVDSHGRA